MKKFERSPDGAPCRQIWACSPVAAGRVWREQPRKKSRRQWRRRQLPTPPQTGCEPVAPDRTVLDMFMQKLKPRRVWMPTQKDLQELWGCDEVTALQFLRAGKQAGYLEQVGRSHGYRIVE
jgi:hypothetical protein